MKISVIIGVTHMTLGVFVKASNALYFRKYIDFFFEFIPQLLFMVLMFGYMDFLIVYKWLQDWGYYSATAPSIITTMINLPLRFGQTVKIILFRILAAEECRCGELMVILHKILFKNGF